MLPKLIDDRGEPCRAVTSPFAVFGTGQQGLTRGESRRIERSASAGGWSSPRVRRDMILSFALAMPVFLAPAPLPALVTSHMRGTAMLALMPPLALLGAAGPLTLVVLLRTFGRDRIARAYVWEGRCGACAFALDGLGAGEDGCTVCPECGAAWVLRPVAPRSIRA